MKSASVWKEWALVPTTPSNQINESLSIRPPATVGGTKSLPLRSSMWRERAQQPVLHGQQQSVPCAKPKLLLPLDNEQPPKNCGTVVFRPHPVIRQELPLGQTSMAPPLHGL